MARISTYRLDDVIRSEDLLLGSSLEGQGINGDIYKTRNYRLSDLAVFFSTYDADIGSSLLTDIQQNTSDISALDTRLTTAEGTILTNTSSISTNTSSISTINTNIQNRSNWDEAYSWGDHDGLYALINHNHDTQYAALNHNHDSQYAALSHNHDSQYAALNHNHDDRYYTETEIDASQISQIDITEAQDQNGDWVKTVTLKNSSGSTIASDTFTDRAETGGGGTDTNYYLSSASLDSNGVLQLGVTGSSNFSVDFDARYYTETEINTTLSSYALTTALPTNTSDLNNDSGYIGLTSISVGTDASPNGNGGISYNDLTGVFTYTPPDFSGSYLSTSGGTLTGNLTIQGILSVTGSGTSNFSDDVSVDGDLSVDGAFTVSTVVGDLRGDVYSIVGATSSVKVLESGSGNTPDAYFIGDLRNSQTDQVFDTDTATFRKDVSIGLSTTSTNNLNMHGASKIWFDEGISEQEQYIDKVKVSQWDFSVLTSSKFQMGQTTGTPPEDLIQFNINGASGLTSSLSIKPGTYISASTDTDNHVLLDVNNTTLANLYVGKTGGQSMQGPLSITAGNLTVSGAGTFIEGDGKIDIYDTSATKILDHANAWFKGDLRGGDLQDVDGNNIFDSSTSTFASDITIVGENITLGASSTSLSATELSSIKNNVVESIKFEKVSSVEEIRLVIGNPTDNDLNSQTVLKAGAYINITADDNTPANPIMSVDTGASGLITKSELSNFGVTSLTANGTSLNGAIEITASNGLSVSGDGTDNQISIAAVDATTDLKGVVQLATTAEAEDLSANASSNKVITLQTLNDALSQEITTPNLQQVTNNDGNVTTHFLGVGDFDPQNSNSPSAPLHIKDNDTLKAILDNNSTTKSEIKFSDSASTSLYVGTINGFGYISQSSGNSANAGISIRQTDGNVGIGTGVDDNQKLKVGGALLATGNISSSQDVVAVNVDASGDVTAGTNITLDASLGTVSATNADFSGTLNVGTLSSLDGGIDVGANFNINSTGTITGSGAIWNGAVIASAYLDSDTAHLSGVQTFSGAKTFSQNVTALDFVLSGSDRELKKDIQPIQKEYFDFEFKQYKYKGKDDLRYGVIAQDIEQKHPEFVKETEDGIKTVSYIDLLVAKVAELENRIKDMENANR